MGNAPPTDAVQKLWPQVTQSPELHLHRLDIRRNTGLFIHMTQGAYRNASFLDGRIITPRTVGGWIPLSVIRETVLSGPPPDAPLHFIFHMGHTGSTLLSRLLDETGTVQPLREPLVLREWAELYDSRGNPASLLAPVDIDAVMEIMLRLWSRCRETGQTAIVKATSTAARAAAPLMTARTEARAVYLSMAPEPYLAAMLAGSGSPNDLRGHAEERMRRLIGYLETAPRPLYALGAGELAAASWVTEALTRERLRQAVGERLLALDFDLMLAQLAVNLDRVLDHLGLPGGSEMAERIARSRVLNQHSKAPEHAYSPELRRQVIQESRRQHRAEIARGMAFLEELGTRHSEVADILP